jgi:hypothetical protein
LGFTASLHPLSVWDGVRAAALRTPRRTAVVEDDGTAVMYAELMTTSGGSPLRDWLATLRADRSADENRAAAEGLSHRELVLQAFDRVVVHAAFDRDGHMATTLPSSSPSFFIAATISLWLGGTLHLLPAGDITRLAAGIAEGRFDTCWIGAADLTMLEQHTGPLTPPAERFVLALCEGEPGPRLKHWLGRERATG